MINFLKKIKLKYPLFRFLFISIKNSIIVIFLSLFSGITQSILVLSIYPLMQFIDQENSTFKIDYLDKIYFSILNFFNLSNSLILVISLLIILTMIVLLMDYFIEIYVAKIYAQITYDHRKKFSATIFNSNLDFYNKKKQGEIINGISVEPGKIAAGYSDSCLCISKIVIILVLFANSLFISFYVTIYCSLVMLIAYITIFRWFEIQRITSKYGNEANKKLIQNLSIFISVFKPIKAMGKLDYAQINLKKDYQYLKLLQYKIVQVFLVPKILVRAIVVLFLGIGIYLNFKYQLVEIASIVMQIALFNKLIGDFMTVVGSFQSMKKQQPFFDSYSVALNIASNNIEINKGKNIPELHKNIKFENVHFSHKKQIIFEKLNIEIPAKKITLLFGKSGSGKTTLLDIICGFYKANSGTVSVDEININEFDLYSWRKKIGYVGQEVILFNDTIKNNILLGKENFSDEKYNYILELSNCKEFMIDLKEFDETIVGEKGYLLSGGQRQRIMLARALADLSKILILDEPTSSLDKTNESYFFDSLRRIKAKGITIVIATHSDKFNEIADNVIKL